MVYSAKCKQGQPRITSMVFAQKLTNSLKSFKLKFRKTPVQKQELIYDESMDSTHHWKRKLFSVHVRKTDSLLEKNKTNFLFNLS